MKNVTREIARIVAGAYYDHQEVRKSSQNRIRDVIRKKNEGIEFDAVEDKKKKEEKWAEKYKDSEIPKLLKQMVREGKLTQEEVEYIEKERKINKEAEKLENKYKNLMSDLIQNEEVWMEFLQHIKGISMILTANLIKEFGYCEKFDNVAKLWAYCGLHTVCPECTETRTIGEGKDEKEIKVPVATELSKDGISVCPHCEKKGVAMKKRQGVSLRFNQRLRTLAWKISDSFIKQRTPYYRGVYDREKKKQLARMEKETKNAPKNKLHADLRARRKTSKLFLSHYWGCTRELSGQDTRVPYVKEKLNHTNIVTWRDVLKKIPQKKPTD